jgi:dethiobiotin synthetase
VIGYFITGTDTNVGKTYVTCALATRARARGRRVFAFKPIETGCTPGVDGKLVGADQELLCDAAGDWQKGPLRGVFQFKLPAAPLVAAEAEGSVVDLDLVLRVVRQGAELAPVTLVEGAGGWRVPITHAADMGAMARAVGFPVVIVARAGLGTINHTLLTIEAVERDGLAVAGVVLSERPSDDRQMTLSNREQILRCGARRVVILGEPEALDVFLSEPGFASVPRETLG